MKVLNILEKTLRMGMGENQTRKKASEVPAGLGSDTCSAQHHSENGLLLKDRGLKKRVGWGTVEARPLPLPTSFLGRALNSTETSLST